jgi:hypothetical protein
MDGTTEEIKAAHSAALLAVSKGASKVEKSVVLMVALKAAWWVVRKVDGTAAQMDSAMAAEMVAALADVLVDWKVWYLVAMMVVSLVSYMVDC